MDPVTIKNSRQQIEVENSCVDESRFVCASAQRLHLEDVNLSGTKISNANMSDVEIEMAQLGGAYIHSIGLPPSDHPFHVPGARQRPLRFEECDLNHSTFSDCDLTGVAIMKSRIAGMTINGIAVEEMMEAYNRR